jgi:two-component system, OmpR family, sensor kinase
MQIRSFVKHYYPAIILLFSLTAFTLYSYYELASIIKTRREKLFEQRSAAVAEVLNKRLLDYIQILKGCQSLFYTSDSVTAAQWRTYVTNLNLEDNYPGIQAVAYAPYISQSDVSGLELRVKKSGHEAFRVKSDFKNKYLTPILFIEPHSGRNLRAFGFDMYSEALRKQAMDQAMATGKPALTRKVKLVQETNENIQPGFLLYVPVYRNLDKIKGQADRVKNLKGFVYNPFRAHDLMNAIFKDYDDLLIEVYDGEKFGEKNLLYRSGSFETSRSTTELVADTSIYPAGTRWNIRTFGNHQFGSTIESRQPALALVFGFAITLLMVVISVNVINNRAHALQELAWTKEIETKKDEFIGIASHELKTPLTSIRGYVQLLEKSDLKENQRHFVEKATAQIKKLNNLIADLLDVSKIQAGKLQLNTSPLELRDLIADSIDSVRHMYSSHQIVLLTDIPEISINGDKFRLEQAITNLLINAIKYSPLQDKVFMSIKQDETWVSIAVRDEGIGISAESQKRIFEKFYRSEDLASSFSGLGMGLYLSHEIVDRHGGIITVVSEPGAGSTFTIRLPLG